MSEEKKIEEYVKLLGHIQERVGDEKIAARILTELSKDRRMEQIQAERNGNGNGESGDLASAKQIQYLKALGGTPTASTTRQEASAMIDAFLAANGN